MKLNLSTEVFFTLTSSLNIKLNAETPDANPVTVPSSRQSGALSLVEIRRDTVLWLVEIMIFYAIKTQLKAPPRQFLPFSMSLEHKRSGVAAPWSQRIKAQNLNGMSQCLYDTFWPRVLNSASTVATVLTQGSRQSEIFNPENKSAIWSETWSEIWI